MKKLSGTKVSTVNWSTLEVKKWQTKPLTPLTLTTNTIFGLLTASTSLVKCIAPSQCLSRC